METEKKGSEPERKRPVAKAAGGEPEEAPVLDDAQDPTAFILSRARSEVHLLLDNISANPEVTIGSLSERIKPRGLPKNWIEQVCEITWPPAKGQGNPVALADQAALLIKTRDYLNGLAKPASGATIAFTLMVTQGGARRIRRRRQAEAGGARPPSRTSLAAEAYPDLVNKARGFRGLLSWTLIWSGFALVLTLFLSWYLAVGNAALADYAAAHTALVEAEMRVGAATSALNGGVGPTAVSGVPTPAPVRSTAPAVGAPQRKAQPSRLGQALPTVQSSQVVQTPPAGQAQPVVQTAPAGRYTYYPCKGVTAFPSAELRDACLARKLIAERFLAIRAGLGAWAPFSGPDTAGWWANLLGSGVLPVLYGFLGAIASVVRSLSRKIKDSLLSPRDVQLTFQQLALGAVVGACISLFIAAPDGDDTSLLGPVALSSSAVSFVAGFGVESVFKALEALISRIFNIAPAGTAPKREDPPRK